MTTARLEIPPKLIPVFSGPSRYRGAYGGRGSAKTRTFALMTAVRAYMFAEAGESGVILGLREFMNSLEDSSMEEIKQAIRSVDWLNDYFDVGERYIRTKNRRVWYGFSGMRHNLDSIKSKARILLAWVDEAEPTSEIAWQKLIPTVREEGSEIWVTWNPETKGSPTDRRFRIEPPSNAKIVQMNHTDNPWFPSTLDQERKDDHRRLDPNTYAWIWEGAYLESSDAQVFAGKWAIEEFEPGQGWEPMYGADWGFAQDATTAVETYVHDGVLYIRREAYKVGLELDETAGYFKRALPGIDKYTMRSDSARPETISYLKRKGLPRLTAVKKWPGSVEDGVEHIRSYERIVIHPDCVHAAEEFRLYSYKVHRQTGDILPEIKDDWNHVIDAVRYALQPLIRQKSVIFEVL